MIRLKKSLSIMVLAGIVFTTMPVCVIANDFAGTNSINESVIEQIGAQDESSSYQLTDDDKVYKQLLVNDIRALEDETPGKDYVRDEVIALCDDKETASLIAGLYSAALKDEVILTDFTCGVATYQLKSTPVSKALECAADMSNNLPPVYANNYEYIDDDITNISAVESMSNGAISPVGKASDTTWKSINYSGRIANTGNECFIDPNTKATSKYYQFFHEVIDDKFLWHEMDNGNLKTDRGEKLKDAIDDTVVAVIDTGINLTGEDFNRNHDMGGGYNPVYVGAKCFNETCFSNNGDCGAKDDHGHGSNVAGIIADLDNSLNGRGVAAGVSIMPLKTFYKGGGGKESFSVAAIRYATKARVNYEEGFEVGTIPTTDENDAPAYNVRVINMSLGGSSFSTAYVAAINEAFDAGILICAAAGNYGMEGRYFPACYEHVISVAAINSDYRRSSFSDYGEGVDVCAPGGESGYDYRAPGYTRTEVIYASDYASKTGVTGKAGTSQATPVASAVTALAATLHPDMSAGELSEYVKSTTYAVDSNEIGTGCVNAAFVAGLSNVPDMPESRIMTFNEKEAVSANAISGKVVVDGGTFDSRTSGVHLSIKNRDGVIYYTTNGKDPVVNKLVKPGDEDTDDVFTHIYDGTMADKDSWIFYGDIVDGSEKVIKCQTLLYGRLSEVKTISLQAKQTFVGEIVLSPRIVGKTGIVSGVETDGTPFSKISLGGSIALDAQVLPANAHDKAVTYKSLDTSVATVNERGVVKALAVSDTPVAILATAADNSGIEAKYNIYVTPLARHIQTEITDTAFASDDTVLLRVGADSKEAGTASGSYDMSVDSGAVTVFPMEALQAVSYKSSNPKVVTVSGNGMVTAVGAGNAVVTVTTLDGTNKKDVQKFKVESPVYSIKIEDKNTSVTRDKVAGGKKLTPLVTFNDGKSNPDDTRLRWSLVNEFDEQYIKLDERTGLITARDNAYLEDASHIVTIRATSVQYGVHADYTFTVYPATFRLDSKEELTLRTSYSAGLDDFMDVNGNNTPGNTMDLYAVSSSNPYVAVVTKDVASYRDICIAGMSYGETVITVKALDGTDKVLKFTLNVLSNKAINRIGIAFDGNTLPVYYPGKKLRLRAANAHHVDSYGVVWSFSPSMNTSVGRNINIDDDGNIKMNNGVSISDSGTAERIYLYSRYGNPSSFNSASYSSATYVDVYSAPVESLKLSGISAVVKNGRQEINGNTILLDRIGDKAELLVKSLPSNSCQSYYTFSSSNRKVVSVTEEGLITAQKNGTATITVIAGDGSGKKLKIKVEVNQAKAKRVTTDIPAIRLSTIDTDTVSTIADIDLKRVSVEPAEAVTALNVSSLNNKIAKVSQDVTDPSKYVVEAVGRGTTYVKIAADDGSNKSVRIKVTVETPVEEIKISSSTKNFILRPQKSLGLKASVNKLATNKKVTWHFADESMKQYATLNSATGKLTAKNADVVGDSEHIISVYAKALDFAGFISEPMSIVIAPKTGTVLMRNLSVMSKTGMYEVGAGSKLAMKATTSVDATNKKVRFYLDDIDEALNVIGTPGRSQFAIISNSGVIKASRNVTEVTKIRVAAIAVDGSGVMNYRIVTIYPKIKKVNIKSVKNGNGPLTGDVNVVKSGDTLYMDISAESSSGAVSGNSAPLQKFDVTYKATGGCGKAYYVNSNGSSIKIKGFKPGQITITAVSTDGSGKSKKYKIQVIE